MSYKALTHQRDAQLLNTIGRMFGKGNLQIGDRVRAKIDLTGIEAGRRVVIAKAGEHGRIVRGLGLGFVMVRLDSGIEKRTEYRFLVREHGNVEVAE